jgi:hypothetical protein
MARMLELCRKPASRAAQRYAVGAAAVGVSAGAVPFLRAEALPVTGVGYLLMPGAAIGMPME